MRVVEMQAILLTHFSKLDTIMSELSKMGDAAHTAGNTPMQHALEAAYGSADVARKNVIVALATVQPNPPMETANENK